MKQKSLIDTKAATIIIMVATAFLGFFLIYHFIGPSVESSSKYDSEVSRLRKDVEARNIQINILRDSVSNKNIVILHLTANKARLEQELSSINARYFALKKSQNERDRLIDLLSDTQLDSIFSARFGIGSHFDRQIRSQKFD